VKPELLTLIQADVLEIFASADWKKAKWFKRWLYNSFMRRLKHFDDALLILEKHLVVEGVKVKAIVRLSPTRTGLGEVTPYLSLSYGSSGHFDGFRGIIHHEKVNPQKMAEYYRINIDRKIYGDTALMRIAIKASQKA
jgi:hypothetical protein